MRSPGSTYTKHTLRPDQLDQLVLDGTGRVALGIGLIVAEISNVTFLVAGGSMRLVLGIDCYQVSNRTIQLVSGRLTVGTCRGAAVCVVSEGVNVHASLGIGVIAGNVPGNSSLAGFGLLLKRHGAFDVGVSTENGHYG